jgi:DNA-binding transcriptional LysR family regulator
MDLAELADESFVLFPPGMRSRMLEIIVSACADAGFAPRITQEAEQLHTLLALVSAGLGVTLVPEWVARSHPSGIRCAHLNDPLPPYELLLAWNKDTSNPAVSAFRHIADRTTREEQAKHADLNSRSRGHYSSLDADAARKDISQHLTPEKS